MLFFKKNKKNPLSEQKIYGFSFSKEPIGFSSNPAVLCTLKALLVFCASFGTIGGLLSAFHVNYNVFVVMTVMLVLSFVLAFLHYNAVVFNIVYPVLFVIFTYTIIKYRVIANSGFQSFLSILYEEYSSYFELSLTREVTTSYANQYIAITVAAIFVGFFLALLLNIAISTYMSLFLTLLFTFPFLQLAIYIENYPDLFYLFLILFSYVSIGVLKRSCHYDLPLKKKKRILFQTRKKVDKTGTYTLHNYKANGPVLFQTIGLLVILSLLFMAASYSLLLDHTAQQSVSNSLKAKTDEYVKIYVQSGISGFFDRYAATGGISGGKLGGVSAVRPDYEPDLTVTFAPYSYDTIYLKAFTGADYTGSEWLAPSHSEESIQKLFGNDYDNFLEYTAGIEAERLAYLFEKSSTNLKGKMKIENLDANPDYLYLPYFTENISKEHTAAQGIYSGSLQIGDTLEVSFYPSVNTGVLTGSFSEKDIPLLASSFPLNASSKEKSYLEIYNMNNQIYYQNIPSHLESLLANIKDEIGTVATLEDQILLIQDYFANEFTYSTNPGTTPMDEDFVEYFLTTQKQGYCAHFASAATLLFRSYGYPARYVEGYVVTFQDMSNAHEVEENYEEYLQGENPLGKTGVIEADITDGNAHAWVEVYKEGFGWIPVEVTPPSSESENTYSDFWDVFSGLFSVSDTSGVSAVTNQTAENQTSRLDAFLSSTDLLTGPILMLIFCLILVPLLIWAARKLITFIKMIVSYFMGNYEPMLSYYYMGLIKKLKGKKCLSIENPSPEQIKKLLLSLFAKKNQLDMENDLIKYIDILEMGCYSKNGILKNQALWFKQMTKAIKKRVD